MAKIVKTERERRWDKIWTEYQKTIADPDNAGATAARAMVAVSTKLRIPLSTVRSVVQRKEAAL